ncbi:hypothetical protein [uncultured Draconibacterium sp.]|nr:hypothetical protein [uncultured Draconibacterium sp.]
MVYLGAMEVVDVETYGTIAGTIASIIAENNEAVISAAEKMNW